jgi:hypothetical protein
MNQEQMKMRTKEFAKQAINLCRQLPNTREGRLIGNQLNGLMNEARELIAIFISSLNTAKKR